MVLVDSNVLLDIITDDPVWGSWSATTLESVADQEPLLINLIVYSEVSVKYPTLEDLDSALSPMRLGRQDIPFAAGFLAGKAQQMYRQRGGLRRSTLGDFYIGAHAAVAGHRLLTRDATRYRSYFPKLDLIAPN